ncbi:Concanavalin A-like lectin/glucanase, subgroup [Artemisia annua]|uniref:Concanavalin A-like lectin/glucanase, subgroup n=1 Tax=Artemisia annua TaxID=35608 RepID=A0A2U1PX08_ARTAN|nr:Concanavalin A-like lectin/glucanase, subgroup [Artemisia annua]
MKNLQSLALSQNKLTGIIPEGFGKMLTLEHFFFSFNQLEGHVPDTSIFRNTTLVGLLGNLSLCYKNDTESCTSSPVLCYRHARKNKVEKNKTLESEDTSSLGIVYKGKLQDGTMIAVKNLNFRQLSAKSDAASYDSECQLTYQLPFHDLGSSYNRAGSRSFYEANIGQANSQVLDPPDLKESNFVKRNILEAKSMLPGIKSLLLAKIHEYRNDLNILKSELKRLHSSNANVAERDELLESRRADIMQDLKESHFVKRNILEAKSMLPGIKSLLLAKIHEYRNDLNILKSELKRLHSSNANVAERDELLESRRADIMQHDLISLLGDPTDQKYPVYMQGCSLSISVNNLTSTEAVNQDYEYEVIAELYEQEQNLEQTIVYYDKASKLA